MPVPNKGHSACGNPISKFLLQYRIAFGLTAQTSFDQAATRLHAQTVSHY